MPDTMFYDDADCDLAAFAALTARRTQKDDVPMAMGIERNVPLYDGAALRRLQSSDDLARLRNELAWVLGNGPGVFAIRSGMEDLSVLDASTDVFMQMIAAQGAGAGDHFAKSGSNARIWNAAQKLCLAAPDLHARYFGNPLIVLACEAWLGPGFQMTSQVNLVRPGGAAQDAHRDYHLGFAKTAALPVFPAHAHHLSAALTLQGAVAHCDMPVDSGPTQLLPFSQLHGPGYLAYTKPDYRAHFAAHAVQIPLEKGDLLFFNPALFHAAGENRSPDIERFANLLQVSSAFGRAMERLDRQAMCVALYPVLQRMVAAGEMSDGDADAAMACTAEGYAFPTNLDTDPPISGCAPDTPADLMRAALARGDSPEAFAAALNTLYARRAA